MGDRKWENLPLDCLVDIFSRVGTLSLKEGAPFVCKSWYKATLSPLCWQSLFFPDVMSSKIFWDSYPPPKNLLLRRHNYFTSGVNFAIRRSHGSANVIVFPLYFPLAQEALNSIGEGCPCLKRLVLPLYDFIYKSLVLSSVICKWKDLESLEIGRGFMLEKVIPEISAHCKKFVSLTYFNANIGHSKANAISEFLPNIEFLSFRNSYIKRSNLVTILKGCKKLLYFDAGLWTGFSLDDEIKNLSAYITTFKFVVSTRKIRRGCDELSSDDSNYGYNSAGCGLAYYGSDLDSDYGSDYSSDY